VGEVWHQRANSTRAQDPCRRRRPAACRTTAFRVHGSYNGGHELSVSIGPRDFVRKMVPLGHYIVILVIE